MQTVTTITPKFQVHIPRKIREKIGLTKHGRAKISAKNRTIVIEPLPDEFLSLGGTFSVQRPVPAEKIRNYIDYTTGRK